MTDITLTKEQVKAWRVIQDMLLEHKDKIDLCKPLADFTHAMFTSLARFDRLEKTAGIEPLSVRHAFALCEQAEKIATLETELSTSETFVATLQEQKYAWDELQSQLAAANERADKAEECIFSMWETDKTPRYEYTDTKSNKNRFGELPKGIGARWRTPREIAQSLLGEQQLIEKHDAALAQEGKNDNV